MHLASLNKHAALQISKEIVKRSKLKYNFLKTRNKAKAT